MEHDGRKGWSGIGTAPGMRPMSEFDANMPAIVHDHLNDKRFEWLPDQYAENYRRYASEHDVEVIGWDGLLLNGWLPLAQD